MALVSLSTLRTRVRELTNTDTSAPTTHHITDTFLDRCINRWRRRFYDKLIEHTPEDFARTKDVTLVASRSEYSEAHGFPQDFYVAIIVLAYDGSRWRRLERFQHAAHLEGILNQEAQGSGGQWSNYTYRIQSGDRVLEVRPVPSAAGDTIRLVYAPSISDLTQPLQEMDGVNGWEDWIVYRASADVAIRKKIDPGPFFAQSKAIQEHLEFIGAQRDMSAPQYIQDTLGDLEPVARPYVWGTYVP